MFCPVYSDTVFTKIACIVAGVDLTATLVADLHWTSAVERRPALPKMGSVSLSLPAPRKLTAGLSDSTAKAGRVTVGIIPDPRNCVEPFRECLVEIVRCQDRLVLWQIVP